MSFNKEVDSTTSFMTDKVRKKAVELTDVCDKASDSNEDATVMRLNVWACINDAWTIRVFTNIEFADEEEKKEKD